MAGRVSMLYTRLLGFLTYKKGTGKTRLLQSMIEELTTKYQDTPGSLVVTATNGFQKSALLNNLLIVCVQMSLHSTLEVSYLKNSLDGFRRIHDLCLLSQQPKSFPKCAIDGTR